MDDMYNRLRYEKIEEEGMFALNDQMGEQLGQCAYICEPSAEAARRAYYDNPARAIWTEEFETEHRLYQRYRYTLYDFMIEAYYRYGLYAYTHKRSIDSLRPIPREALCKDPTLERALEDMDTVRKGVYAEPGLNREQFQSLEASYNQEMEALYVAIARVAYRICEAEYKQMEKRAEIYEEALSPAR